MGSEIGDEAVCDQHAAGLIEAGRRIDQPRIDERCRAGGRALVLGERLHRRHRFGRWRARAWSTAMRTATPISTCSRMTLRAPSAALEPISPPLVIRPGS